MADEEVGKLVATLTMDSLGFQDGIDGINRQLKIIQSELKLSTAQFGAFGSATDKLGAQAASLSKQIDLQAAKVDSLQKSLAKSAEQSGEGSKQTDLLTRKVNLAQAALFTMQQRLDSTNSALKEQSVGVDDLNNTLAGLQRQLGVAQSAYKLSIAEFGDMANAGQILETKIKSLTDQISTQRQIVDELQQTYQKSAETLGENADTTQNLAVKVNDAKTALLNMETELQRANKDLSSFNSGMKESSNQAHESNGIFSTLGETIKSALVFSAVYEGLNLVKQGLENVISAGIQFDSQMQNQEIAFTNLLGSASKAKEMLNQLADFAQSTPFDLTGVEQSATQMLAMGFDAQQILPDMKAIGDAAAALGLQTDGIQRLSLALGQLRTHGTADAQDLDQLTEAGIPAWDMLAQSIGKSIPELRDMVQKGLIPGKQASDALIADMEAKYPDMLQKMNSSFTSEMGNLGDSFKRTFGDIMQPEFNWLTNTALPEVNSKMNTFRQTLEQAGTSAAFKTILPASVVDTVDEFADGIKSIFSFVEQDGPEIKAILEGIAAGFAAFAIATTVESAIAALNKLIVVFETLDLVMGANPLGVMAVAIGALVTAIALLRKAWTSDWGGIQEKTEAVVNVIKSYFVLLVKGIETEFDGLEAGVLAILEDIMKMVQPVIGIIGKIAPGFESGFKNVESSIDDARKNSVARLTDALNQSIGAAENLAVAGQNVAASFSSAAQAAAEMPSGFTEGADGVPVMHAHNGPQAPVVVQTAAKQTVTDTVSATDTALRNAITSGTGSSVSSAKKSATQAAEDIVQSYMDGLNNKLAPLQQTIDQLQARIQFRTDQGNTSAVNQANVQLAEAYKKQMTGLQSAMASVNAEIKKLNPKTQADDIAQLKDQYSQLATTWWNDRDALTKLNTTADQAATKVTSLINAADSNLTPMQNAVSTLQAQIQYLQDSGQSTANATKQISDQYNKEIKSIQSSIKSLTAEMDKLNPKTQGDLITQIKSKIDDLNTSLYNTKDALAQIQQQSWQAAASAFESISNQDISSINTALQNELTAIQTAHQQALDQFDAVTQAADQQFQDQLNALQQQSTNDDRASQQADWNSQMTDLQHQLAVANLMGDTSTINQVTQQIASLNEQIQQQQQAWAIQDQEQAIQQQQSAYDAQRAAQRTALDQQYTDLENEKQQEITLEESKFAALQTALESAVQQGQLTQAQAQDAWLQAINDTGEQQLQLQIQADQDNQKELNSWIQSYVDIGKKYGTNLASGLVAGLNSMLGAVQSAAAQLASAASMAIGAGAVSVSGAVATIKVPALAKGGIFNGAALVGEGRYPEAAIPLDNGTMAMLASAIVAQMPGGGMGNQPINIIMDSQVIGSFVWNAAAGELQVAQRKGA
ncbi:tape measure protein [Alicyclobacillus fodiniaquatilis]|uniref:Tape measure protein n=1 Tax=Alicyclobacillus fodiniaquatilis TaxID=1661150 RepID=A0ABW4JGU8_9BACL